MSDDETLKKITMGGDLNGASKIIEDPISIKIHPNTWSSRRKNEHIGVQFNSDGSIFVTVEEESVESTVCLFVEDALLLSGRLREFSDKIRESK